MIDELAQQPHIAEHMGGMMRQPTPGGTGGNGFFGGSGGRVGGRLVDERELWNGHGGDTTEETPR
ncbi:hypothetical protein [Kitasatospora sp. NRRL B-11411]|uniref:hypothetical protein n=1 Tax=Kitasatospora sp. NRRL B-11411 TaxID=1463822 RepID=UPI0012FF170B|nr:hypothetical protein [Kitasatospora sp. NRRL B-11411]